MRRFVALVYFVLASSVGCAGAYRPAVGTGKPLVRVVEFRRIVGVRVEVRRLVAVNNPTDEDVIVDCDSARFRVPAHLAADVLLMPGDTHCDAHNDQEYQSIPDVPALSAIGAAVKAKQ